MGAEESSAPRPAHLNHQRDSHGTLHMNTFPRGHMPSIHISMKRDVSSSEEAVVANPKRCMVRVGPSWGAYRNAVCRAPEPDGDSKRIMRHTFVPLELAENTTRLPYSHGNSQDAVFVIVCVVVGGTDSLAQHISQCREKLGYGASFCKFGGLFSPCRTPAVNRHNFRRSPAVTTAEHMKLEQAPLAWATKVQSATPVHSTPIGSDARVVPISSSWRRCIAPQNAAPRQAPVRTHHCVDKRIDGESSMSMLQKYAR